MRRLVVSAVGAATIFASGVTSAAITAKSYVSDGLVGQWDGKENAGYGVFDAEATSWADLTGKSVSFPVLSDWSFSEDGLTVTRASGSQNKTGYAGSAFARAYANANFTVEIAYNKTEKTPSDSGGYGNAVCTMLSIGQWQRNVGTLSDTAVGFDSPAKPTTSTIGLQASVSTTVGQHTFSCRQDGVNWVVDFDGVVQGSGSNAGTIEPTDVPTGDGLMLNRHFYTNAGLDGQYYSIRFYNRPLTDDEVAVNRAVDKIRYFGADPGDFSLPEGWRFTAGEDVRLEREVSIALKDGVGGKLSVGGGEWTGSASLWIEQGVGSQVAVRAQADEGYVFQGWSGAVSGEDLTLADTTITVKGTAIAVFRKTDGSDPRTYSLVGSVAEWDDPAAWTDEYGFKGVPQAGDSAEIAVGKTVTVDATTESLASLDVSGTLVLTNWTTCLRAADVTVRNGGVITCGAPSRTMEGMSRVWIACSNLTVAAGGKIDVALKGYRGAKNSLGAGPGASAHSQMTAPSHGGFGAVSQVSSTKVTGKLPYDDPAAPTQPGSSGSMSEWQLSADWLSNGGGAVRVEATGAVTVNGSIQAYGADSDRSGSDSSYYNQPGAGGSVFITCRSFAGSGKVDACGGNGEWVSVNYYNRGLPAGGGCIAIHYDAEAQRSASVTGMTITADCGRCKGSGSNVSSNVDDRGDPYGWNADIGTLHFTDDQIVRALVGKGLTGQIRGLDSFVWDGDLDFTSGRVRFATEGVQVTVNGDLTLAGDDSRLEIGGCSATNWAHHTVLYSGVVPCGLTVNGDLTLSGTSRLDIRSAATAINSGTGATVTVSGQMTVATNCRVYAWSDVVTLGSPAFTVGGLDLQEGALFSADARGGRGSFNSDVSAYAGTTGPAGPSCGSNGSGAGHGGRGGKGGTSSGRYTGGAAYDDVLRPSIPGSGGSKYSRELTGNGGGRILVSAVNGTIRIDGTVTANGEAGYLFDAGKGGSGGSGGSILLEAKTFVGGTSGRLSVEGGSAAPGSVLINGAGAGGRIAVWCGAPWDATARASRRTISETPLGPAYAEFFSWLGTASAAGGTSTQQDSNAEAGTVRYCHMRPRGGILIMVK